MGRGEHALFGDDKEIFYCGCLIKIFFYTDQVGIEHQ